MENLSLWIRTSYYQWNYFLPGLGPTWLRFKVRWTG
jgi:hypothetical protein